MKRIATAVTIAILVFVSSLLAAVAAAPYVLGLMTGCFPPVGSCGDGVGWAMLISTPITVPIIVVISAALAVWAYQATVRGLDP